MTLFEKIKEVVQMGWNINFENQLNHLVITVSKEDYITKYEEEQWLPLQDHFTENRIVDCISMMVGKICENIYPK